MLAAVGAGWLATVEAAAAALVRATPVAVPGPDAPVHANAHARYRDLHPALVPTFHRLAGQARHAPPSAAEQIAAT